jgi:exodeoxyribonuclease VII large subunit
LTIEAFHDKLAPSSTEGKRPVLSLHYRIVGSQIVIFGRTYDHKEALKALGARFNFADKSWSLPHSESGAEKLNRLCARVGGGLIGEVSPASKGPALVDVEGVEPSLKSTSIREGDDGGGSAVLAVREAFPQLEGYSLRELMNGVQMAITQAYPSPVWVFGEISSLANRQSGVFFCLTEPKTAGSEVNSIEIKATLWRSQESNIIKRRSEAAYREVMQEGLRVRMLVQVSVFADRGQVSLNVIDIDPAFTKGALALAREQLLKELRARGLDQANKQRYLGDFPLRVGLITAEGSRAYSDFTDQLIQGGYCGEILFFAAQMQGERTAVEVIEGLSALHRSGCDVIVVTRGGGSAGDLRWFDGRDVAMAVAECPIPVIAAIGHHDDVCVVEQICFQREKTPTAAAESILAILRRTKDRIKDMIAEVDHRVMLRVEHEAERGARFQQMLALNSLQGIQRRWQQLQRLREAVGQALESSVRQLDRRCFALSASIDRAMTERLRRQVIAIAEMSYQLQTRALERIHSALARTGDLERRMIGADPKPWLAKGWTQLMVGSRRIQRVADVKSGELVCARVVDGLIHARVEQIERREENGKGH